jgi:DNA-binding NarL/FixJ family response regulator
VAEAEREGSLVLVAEDHPVNRSVLQRQLAALGYAVELAEDGAVAFERWKSGRYAIVLTDCHMPNMDGYDLVRAIRAVAAGGSLLDPATTAQLLSRLRSANTASAPDPLAELTEQERKVLDLIGQGMTNREIGRELFLAEKTVKNYVSSILAKMGMQRRTQAAVLATELRGRDQPRRTT